MDTRLRALCTLSSASAIPPDRLFASAAERPEARIYQSRERERERKRKRESDSQRVRESESQRAREPESLERNRETERHTWRCTHRADTLVAVIVAVTASAE